jgi:hypothetical protein
MTKWIFYLNLQQGWVMEKSLKSLRDLNLELKRMEKSQHFLPKW